MKRSMVCTMLIIASCLMHEAQSQNKEPKFALGLAAGGAHGSNIGGDEWRMQYRGFLQYALISPMLTGQLGLGYTALEAPGVYSANTGMVDLRLMFSPFSLSNLNPYVYAGLGLSKSLNTGDTDYLGMVPLGAGIQTKISNNLILEISGGYTLSLSDDLDGRVRTNTDLNPLTNKKQDGFYGFTVGLAFPLGRGYDEAAELKKKELADAETRRVKQQVDAEAEARRVKERTDAEARRVKEASDAEARRLKQQADADALARTVKDSTDAEARRVKEVSDADARRARELADAEARRLAEQNRPANTVIILEKGKKVVLKGVNFESNRATLRKDSETILTIAYDALVANPDAVVEISGHTDNVGSEQTNQQLSLKRAQAVRNWLVNKGIASNRLKAVGKGEDEPVAPNETVSGRAENRRIEFFVQ